MDDSYCSPVHRPSSIVHRQLCVELVTRRTAANNPQARGQQSKPNRSFSPLNYESILALRATGARHSGHQATTGADAGPTPAGPEDEPTAEREAVKL